MLFITLLVTNLGLIVVGLALVYCITAVTVRRNSENDYDIESVDHQHHDGESKEAAEESDDVTVSFRSSGDHHNSLEDV